MQILELLRQASHKRPEAVRQFDLYRAFDGAADGVAELFIDRIGPFGVVHLLGENAQARAMEEAIGHIGAELAALLQVTTIYCRIHDRDPKSTSSRAAKILFGPPVPSAIVMEHGLRFLVRPEENVNAGIFLDTRAVRQKLLTLSAGAEVLNTFAFTGSLGVAAYCGGAKSVTQVDASKGILNWARENLELNRTPHGGEMRFICEDCETFIQRELRRASRRENPYSLVILDPPAFGRAGKKVFSLQKDLPRLIQQASSLLSGGGYLVVLSNCRTWSIEDLVGICGDNISASGAEIESFETLLPPSEDFLSVGTESIATRGALFHLRNSGNHEFLMK